jgi:hypothetical protein
MIFHIVYDLNNKNHMFAGENFKMGLQSHGGKISFSNVYP